MPAQVKYGVLTLLLLLLACAGGGPAADVGADAPRGPADTGADFGGAVADTTVTPDTPDLLVHDLLPMPDELSVPDVAKPPDTSEPADSTADDTSEPVPWPVPELAEEPAPTCQAAIDDPWYFQFLDNLCAEKVWPTDTDRDRPCPVADDSPFMTLPSGEVVEYKPSDEPVTFDTTSLDGLLPPGMRVVVILVKRIDGVPHYRYLSNGTHEVAQQPWSTTKFLAVANAAATLRIQSQYAVGLTAAVGSVPLGDLVTSIHNYDDAPYSSNGLGKYFHNIGGRARANALIHEDWLDRPAGESFGGNYGAAAPPLGYTFVEPGGKAVTLTPDTSPGPANHLALFTLAEALKRLVLHREEPSQRLPGIQWLDLRVLFYGAEASSKYGPWGGMTADTAIYLQAGHDMDYIEARSLGQWRIFSKLGLGSQGQFMDVGYACWPALHPDGSPVVGLGREFIIATHLDQGGADWDERDRILARAYRTILLRIVDGRL